MIPKWILKAAVQKTIGFLPSGHRINYLFQKHVTKGVQLNDTYLFDRLDHAVNHWQYYQEFGAGNVPQRTLEIGTGWYPVVPLTFFLAGVQEIYSVDIEMLTNHQHFSTAVNRVLEVVADGRYPKQLPIQPNRLETLKKLQLQLNQTTLTTALQTLGITYLIRDARQLDFPDQHINLVHSNNTFEHIYPNILEGILKEFWRVNCGVMSHFIDMSDHFAHFDQSINVYHFLRFSERSWGFIDNTIQPQNRWRYDDYLQLYKNLQIPITAETHRPGQSNLLESMKLAPPFASKTAATNAITHMHVVSSR